MQSAGRILQGKEPNTQENDLQKLIMQESIKKQFNDSPYNDLIEKAKAVEAAKSTGNRTLYDSLIGGQSSSQSNIASDGLTAPEIDPFTGKESTRGLQQKLQNDIFSKQQEEAALPEKAADAGKSTLAKEAIQNIRDIKKLLYPSGGADSYQRGIATGSNLPGVRLPLVGRITPNVRPDNPFTGKDDLAAQNAQDVYRKLGTAFSGRQLIQTGVAARPEETQKLVEQFAPGLFSNAQASLSGLDQLEKFYIDYLSRVRPNEMTGVQQTSNGMSGTEDLSQLSDEELQAIIAGG